MVGRFRSHTAAKLTGVFVEFEPRGHDAPPVDHGPIDVDLYRVRYVRGEDDTHERQYESLGRFASEEAALASLTERCSFVVCPAGADPAQRAVCVRVSDGTIYAGVFGSM